MLKTGSGGQYKIYTPFWKALREHMPPPLAMPAPARLPAPGRWPESELLEDLGLLPTKPDWAQGLAEEWQHRRKSERKEGKWPF